MTSSTCFYNLCWVKQYLHCNGVLLSKIIYENVIVSVLSCLTCYPVCKINPADKQTSRKAEKQTSRCGSFCVAHLLHASWVLTGESRDHHCWFLVNVPLTSGLSLRWPLGYQSLQILRCKNIAGGVAPQPTPVLRGFSMPLCPRCAQPCIVHSK